MKQFMLLSVCAGTFGLGTVASLSAQMTPDATPCSVDFRPIEAHTGLPVGAIYRDTHAAAEARAADVVARLSFDEKLALTGGYKVFYVPGVPRLGIPAVYMSDATQGVHIKHICNDAQRSTAFPSAQTLAATWDPALAERYAAAIGQECRAWGIGVLLGPGLNLYRNSEGGRNFEYFGEDPLLAARMGVGYIRGVQSTGTVATAKHFLGNEQEFVRHVEDVQIGERALHELYLPPFRAAIEQGGVLAVMTGNNGVNGHPGAADTPLEQGVLRDEYGFRGMIMSDWANSMYWPRRQGEELHSGHSLLMEDNALFAAWVRAEVIAHPERKAEIETALGKMAQENLYSFFKSGLYDRQANDPAPIAAIDSHQEIAREVAEAGITLLKNDGNILPISTAGAGRIAVVGSDEALSVYGGKGSGAVEGYNHIGFLEGLQRVYGGRVQRVAETDAAAIRAADTVLYFISKPASEGMDVAYDIPGVEDAVTKLAALNPNLVVIFSGGNGFAMPWLPKVKGMVFAYLLGQQRGVALADILSGKQSPSGKLPFTIERSFADSPAHGYNTLPDGTVGWGGGRGDSMKALKKFGSVPIKYGEGAFIGYRWYEEKHITPLFPFGFGLSYTTFAYSRMRSSSSAVAAGKDVRISLDVKNTGRCAGAEVVEFYVHPLHPSVDRPTKELKGFEKKLLAPGESATFSMTLAADDLRTWDEATHGWKIDHGEYEVLAGASVEDIRAKVTVRY